MALQIPVAETVASGTTDTISPGQTRQIQGTLRLAGQINLGGELTSTPGVVTILSGESVSDDGANIDGQLNLGGELNVEEAGLQAASGVGEATGTASATPKTTNTAAGSGLTTGTASATPAAVVVAAGVGDGIGSADNTITKAIDADGIGKGFGDGSLTQSFSVVQASGVGELNADASPSVFVNFPTGDGVGTASGDASRQIIDKITGGGTGELIATADGRFVAPLIRGDSFGIDYDDDESVGLNAERD